MGDRKRQLRREVETKESCYHRGLNPQAASAADQRHLITRQAARAALNLPWAKILFQLIKLCRGYSPAFEAICLSSYLPIRQRQVFSW